MQTRALVTGDYQLAAQALKLDSRIQRNLIAQRRLDLQERRARALESEEDQYANMSYDEAIAKIRKELEAPCGW
jgi:hypothetical protein